MSTKRSRLRILHVLHAFSAGGLENGIVNIINRSPDHFEHELCLMTTAGEFVGRLNRPVPYHEFHKKKGNDPSIIWRLRTLIRERGFDVIHTRNWAAFDAVIASCLIPGSVLIHGEHGRDMVDPDGTSFKRNVCRKFFSFRVRKYVAVSRSLHDWLIEQVRIPAGKVVFIPNGVDSALYRPGRNQALRAELGIGAQEIVVGTVGRLDPVKNHEGLIEAVDLLNRGDDRARLVIVGEGPNRRSLETRINSCRHNPVPLLLGFRPDLDRLYGIFDIFVLNSHAEGMSNTILEAMASGLPVVCTKVGGNTELVSNEVTGKHVQPGNAAMLASKISEYLKDPLLRRSHGERARAFVEQEYSLDVMIQHYVRLYESCRPFP